MQNKEAKCIYENDKGKRLELFYNKQYNKLPTTNQRPDTVLCLKGVGKPTGYIYLMLSIESMLIKVEIYALWKMI